MKWKNLIATTCLVAPIFSANVAYADFEFEDYFNKSAQQKFVYKQEDFPELEKALQYIPMEPNPINLPAVTDVIKGNTCGFTFPDDHDHLFKVTMDRIFEGVPEFSSDPENPPALHQYKLFNDDIYQIDVENADWVKAILLDFDKDVINWRNADNPEDAAEEDVRVLINQTRPAPFWVYASRSGNHGDNALMVPQHVHEMGDEVDVYLVKSESIIDAEINWDKPAYNRILIVPAGNGPFDENLNIELPPEEFSFQLEFGQNIAEGETYKSRVNQLPWEESSYRVQMTAFCLDSSHTTFINNIIGGSGT